MRYRQPCFDLFLGQETAPFSPVAVLFSGVDGAFPPHLQPTGVPRGRFGVVVVVVVGLPQTCLQAVHLFVLRFIDETKQNSGEGTSAP